MKKVGIIGGAGYIGSYNTRKFLNEGYAVKVSTTDISKKEKYEHLAHFPETQNLEIVQLDVENTKELFDFLSDCNIVIHGGTPFQIDVKDPQTELLDPTIKGTENFLEAIKHFPKIEKVIVVASVAAHNTNFPFLPPAKKEGEQFDETDELFLSAESHPYSQGKFLANQSVSAFVTANPNVGFEIVSISPVFVFGKALSSRADSSSMGLQFFMKNKILTDAFVNMLFEANPLCAIVDVADVAEAVYKASITNGIHGKTYLISSESYTTSDVHSMLNGHQPKHQAQIVYSSERAKKELGLHFKPVNETLRAFSV